MKELIFLLVTITIVALLLTGYAEVNPVSVNLTLTPTQIWWNESVFASGYAMNDTTPFNSTYGYIQVNHTNGKEILICNVTADTTTGYYSCSFNASVDDALLEIGSYNYIAYAVNKTGAVVGSSPKVKLSVAPFYGKKPIGLNRFVYEVPLLIQDLNGEIKIVFARVILWS